jgi:hypothetical protein
MDSALDRARAVEETRRASGRCGTSELPSSELAIEGGASSDAAST